MDFVERFAHILLDVLQHCVSHCTPSKLTRLIDIWQERKVFSTSFCSNLRKVITTGNVTIPTKSTAPQPKNLSEFPPEVRECAEHYQRFQKASNLTRSLVRCELPTIPSIEELDRLPAEELEKMYQALTRVAETARHEEGELLKALDDKLGFLEWLTGTLGPLRAEIEVDRLRTKTLAGHLDKIDALEAYLHSREIQTLDQSNTIPLLEANTNNDKSRKRRRPDVDLTTTDVISTGRT